ncbi:MAG TPA: hypothetical protein V6D12_20385 [Candidatus Obscuribacterales bacterium]
MAEISTQPEDAVQRNRIMIIGQDVPTVQRISRYCLQQGAEVFPYYGIPTLEEVTLFDPEVSVLCLPMPENFLRQLDQPYIIWSEKHIQMDLPLVGTRQELESSLQAALQN